jgi:phytoene dehydrogenase-like protein
VRTRTPTTALVFGAGHNALICATLLAKAGYAVTVVESQPYFGGAATNTAFNCGCQVSRGANVLSLLDDDVLNLIGQYIDVDWKDLFLVPNPQRILHSAHETLVIRALAESDLVRDLSSQTGEPENAIQRLFEDLGRAALAVADLWTDPFASRSLYVQRLNGVYQGCASDFLDGSIESYVTRRVRSEQLRIAFGALGSLIAAHLNEAGSAFCLLYQASGNLAFSPNYALVRGGIGTISQLLIKTAEASGVRLIAGEGVSAIHIRDSEIDYLVTSSGRRLYADCYVSGFGPAMTQLLCTSSDLKTVCDFMPLSGRGATHETACAKIVCLLPVSVAMEAFRQGDELVVQRVFCAGMDEHSRSAQSANRGVPSDRPTIEVTAPAMIGAERACAEHIPVCIYGLYFPYDWCRSVADESKLEEEICERVFWSLEQMMPGLSQALTIQEVITPLTLERDFGMFRGDVDHGSFANGNVLDRRGYGILPHGTTPTRKLFNCSSGIHPGGFVTGRPGLTCAKTILTSSK